MWCLLTDADRFGRVTDTALCQRDWCPTMHESAVFEGNMFFEKGAGDRAANLQQKTLRNWKGVAEESNKQAKNKTISNFLRRPEESNK